MGKVERSWGQPWNITSTMARNPAVLELFLTLGKQLKQTGLSALDREVICMEMARRNGCHYCVPAHRYVAREEGVDLEIIEQIAQGRLLEGDGRAAVIQRLTACLDETKGKLRDQDYRDFRDHGVSDAEMLAVVAEIAHCTLTNTLNRLAGTELDRFLLPYAEGRPAL